MPATVDDFIKNSSGFGTIDDQQASRAKMLRRR